VSALDPKKEALLKPFIKHGNVDASGPLEDSGPLFFITMASLLQAIHGNFWSAALLLLDGGADVKARVPDYMFSPFMARLFLQLLSRVICLL
jgi:hypothetical protein